MLRVLKYFCLFEAKLRNLYKYKVNSFIHLAERFLIDGSSRINKILCIIIYIFFW
jgi:hypothetical protein